MVTEGLNRSINRLELDHEDFSPVSFYRFMNNNRFASEIDEKILGGYIYILNVLNFCGKVKIYEIQKLFHIATIPTKPV